MFLTLKASLLALAGCLVQGVEYRRAIAHDLPLPFTHLSNLFADKCIVNELSIKHLIYNTGFVELFEGLHSDVAGYGRVSFNADTNIIRVQNVRLDAQMKIYPVGTGGQIILKAAIREYDTTDISYIRKKISYPCRLPLLTTDFFSSLPTYVEGAYITGKMLHSLLGLAPVLIPISSRDTAFFMPDPMYVKDVSQFDADKPMHRYTFSKGQYFHFGYSENDEAYFHVTSKDLRVEKDVNSLAPFFMIPAYGISIPISIKTIFDAAHKHELKLPQMRRLREILKIKDNNDMFDSMAFQYPEDLYQAFYILVKMLTPASIAKDAEFLMKIGSVSPGTLLKETFFFPATPDEAILYVSTTSDASEPHAKDMASLAYLWRKHTFAKTLFEGHPSAVGLSTLCERISPNLLFEVEHSANINTYSRWVITAPFEAVSYTIFRGSDVQLRIDREIESIGILDRRPVYKYRSSCAMTVPLTQRIKKFFHMERKADFAPETFPFENPQTTLRAKDLGFSGVYLRSESEITAVIEKIKLLTGYDVPLLSSVSLTKFRSEILFPILLHRFEDGIAFSSTKYPILHFIRVLTLSSTDVVLEYDLFRPHALLSDSSITVPIDPSFMKHATKVNSPLTFIKPIVKMQNAGSLSMYSNLYFNKDIHAGDGNHPAELVETYVPEIFRPASYCTTNEEASILERRVDMMTSDISSVSGFMNSNVKRVATKFAEELKDFRVNGQDSAEIINLLAQISSIQTEETLKNILKFCTADGEFNLKNDFVVECETLTNSIIERIKSDTAIQTVSGIEESRVTRLRFASEINTIRYFQNFKRQAPAMCKVAVSGLKEDLPNFVRLSIAKSIAHVTSKLYADLIALRLTLRKDDRFEFSWGEQYAVLDYKIKQATNLLVSTAPFVNTMNGLRNPMMNLLGAARGAAGLLVSNPALFDLFTREHCFNAATIWDSYIDTMNKVINDLKNTDAMKYSEMPSNLIKDSFTYHGVVDFAAGCIQFKDLILLFRKDVSFFTDDIKNVIQDLRSQLRVSVSKGGRVPDESVASLISSTDKTMSEWKEDEISEVLLQMTFEELYKGLKQSLPDDLINKIEHEIPNGEIVGKNKENVDVSNVFEKRSVALYALIGLENKRIIDKLFDWVEDYERYVSWTDAVFSSHTYNSPLSISHEAFSKDMRQYFEKREVTVKNSWTNLKSTIDTLQIKRFIFNNRNNRIEIVEKALQNVDSLMENMKVRLDIILNSVPSEGKFREEVAACSKRTDKQKCIEELLNLEKYVTELNDAFGSKTIEKSIISLYNTVIEKLSEELEKYKKLLGQNSVPSDSLTIYNRAVQLTSPSNADTEMTNLYNSYFNNLQSKFRTLQDLIMKIAKEQKMPDFCITLASEIKDSFDFFSPLLSDISRILDQDAVMASERNKDKTVPNLAMKKVESISKTASDLYTSIISFKYPSVEQAKKFEVDLWKSCKPYASIINISLNSKSNQKSSLTSESFDVLTRLFFWLSSNDINDSIHNIQLPKLILGIENAVLQFATFKLPLNPNLPSEYYKDLESSLGLLTDGFSSETLSMDASADKALTRLSNIQKMQNHFLSFSNLFISISNAYAGNAVSPNLECFSLFLRAFRPSLLPKSRTSPYINIAEELKPSLIRISELYNQIDENKTIRTSLQNRSDYASSFKVKVLEPALASKMESLLIQIQKDLEKLKDKTYPVEKTFNSFYKNDILPQIENFDSNSMAVKKEILESEKSLSMTLSIGFSKNFPEALVVIQKIQQIIENDIQGFTIPLDYQRKVNIEKENLDKIVDMEKKKSEDQKKKEEEDHKKVDPVVPTQDEDQSGGKDSVEKQKHEAEERAKLEKLKNEKINSVNDAFEAANKASNLAAIASNNAREAAQRAKDIASNTDSQEAHDAAEKSVLFAKEAADKAALALQQANIAEGALKNTNSATTAEDVTNAAQSGIDAASQTGAFQLEAQNAADQAINFANEAQAAFDLAVARKADEDRRKAEEAERVQREAEERQRRADAAKNAGSENSDDSSKLLIIILSASGGFILIAVVVVAVVLIMKKKSNAPLIKDGTNSRRDSLLTDMLASSARPSTQSTASKQSSKDSKMDFSELDRAADTMSTFQKKKPKRQFLQ